MAVTWNSSDKHADIVLSNGGLTASLAGASGTSSRAVRATQGKSSGKWYFEIVIDTYGGSTPYSLTGIGQSSPSLTSSYFPGSGANDYGYEQTGYKYNNASGSAYGGGLPEGNVLGVIVDLDNGKIWWSVNDTVQGGGDPASGTSPAYSGIAAGTYYPMSSLYTGNNHQLTARFSTGDFSYSPPSGFSAWEQDEVTGTAAAAVAVEASGSGTPIVSGAGVATVAAVSAGAGAVAAIGAGVAIAEISAVGFGGPAVQAVGTARVEVTATAEGEMLYPFGEAAALASIGAAATGTSYPAGQGAGRAHALITASGTGAILASGLGTGTIRIVTEAVAGHGAAGTVTATVAVTAAGGDYPIGVGAGTISTTASATGSAAENSTGIWLYIHTTPPVQIYQRHALRARMHPGLPRLMVPFEVSATQAQIGQQNEAFSVRLDRPDAKLRARLATQGPFGVRVDVMDGGTISRSGVITGGGVSIGADGWTELDCEGAGWSADLPLRTNADLGVFRDVVPLPWRFGRAVPGRCVRLGATGTLWLWADHASSAVTSVSVGNQVIGGWSWRNDIDARGNPVTLVQTVDALEEGAEVIATGDGALDPLAGTLMTNPADIVYAICQRAGRSIDRGAMVDFRTECQARGLEISGTIDTGSLQAALAGIAESIYAAFGRNLPGLMRLRPRSSAQVTIPARDTPTAAGVRDGIATRLRVRYALQDGRPRASLEARALAVEALRGSTVAEVTLPWVRDERVARDVASRILADRARPRYDVPAARQQRRLVPGDVVSASVAALGISGQALVVSSTLADRGSTPKLELAAGTAPAIDIVTTASAWTPEQYTGATVTTQGDQRVLTITAPDGRALSGARCTLNGSNVRTTDSNGKVSWPVSLMPPGVHTIEITAAGFAPMTMTVTL